MLVFYPQKKSSYLKIFLHENSTWRVHSLFKNGLNLSNGEDLLFIGTNKNGELPFAVHLTLTHTQELIQQLHLNQLFIFKNNKWLSEDEQIKISLDYTIDFCSKGEIVTSVDFFQIEELKRSVNNLSGKNGFGNKLPMNLELEGYDERFTNAFNQLQSSDKNQIEAGLRYFIGRGEGETPSGDDLLVGLLSVDTAYQVLSQNVRKQLNLLLSTETLTTDIGKAYLKVALSNQFTTTINDLLSELKTRQKNNTQLKYLINQLSKTGHTSGLDTLTGILLGLFIKEKQQY